jgi:hypothetical protein
MYKKGSPTMRKPLLLSLLLALASSLALADTQIPWDLPTLLQKIPPLKHDGSGRLAMVTWDRFRLSADDKSFEDAKPLPPEMYAALAARGLTQALFPDEKYIPMALAIQQAGGQVIFVQGDGGNGAYSEDPGSLHQLPKNYKIPEGEDHYACPLETAGWNIRANKLRATLTKFRDAGVKVTGFWMDWEGEPWPLQEQWNQAKACPRCRAEFPPGVLDDWERYRAYIAELRSELFSAYLAAPVREIYPTCSVTNWEAVFSAPDRVTWSWTQTRSLPPQQIGLLTGSNPIAYGDDMLYKFHAGTLGKLPLNQENMDRLYTTVELAQISQNAAVQDKWSPEKQTIPWVDRYCPDADDPKVPIFSRDRYREVLRHLWLRGATSMQLFQPVRKGHESIATEEVEYAVAVYDEMLAYRKFLDAGKVMNVTVPDMQDPIWSGLQLGDEALVRAFVQDTRPGSVTIRPWADAPAVTLAAPPAGATYLLRHTAGRPVGVQEQKTL